MIRKETKMSSSNHKQRGQATIILLAAFAVIVIAVIAINVIPSSFISSCESRLAGAGYVVFAAGEYDTINSKLDSIAEKADAAVIAAETAVTTAEDAVDAAELATDKVDLFNTAERFVYPYATNLTCTLTAGNTNVWSAWAQITDSGGGNLSSVFTTYTGYIIDMQIFAHSATDKIYLVEIAYGAAKNIIGRVAYHTSFSDSVDIKSELIPVGEVVYYRMMSSGANGATARVGFRYIYE